MPIRYLPDEEDPRKRKIRFLDEEEQKADLSDRGEAAFMLGGAEQIASNLANIPAALLEQIGTGLLGAPPNVERMAQEAGVVSPQQAASNVADMIRPPDRPLAAAAEFLGVPEAEAFSEELAAQNPIADLSGSLGGDVATILAGKKPLQNIIDKLSGREKTTGGMFDEIIDSILDRGSKTASAAAGRTGVAREVQEVLDAEWFRHLARGAGRAGETGLEAAFLSGLEGESDPATVAGIAAGSQALSSFALWSGAQAVDLPFDLMGAEKPKSMGGKITRNGLALTVAGGILGSWLNLFGMSPDQADEAAFDKLGFGVLSAMAYGLQGKRPVPDGLLKNFPDAAEAVLTVPRTAWNNAIIWLAGDERGQTVVQAMQQPGVIAAKEFDGMTKAVEGGTFEEWALDIYQRYNLQDTELGLTPEAAATPIKRRDRGPGFDR